MLITGLPSGLTFEARRWNLKDQRTFISTIQKSPGVIARVMVQVAAGNVVDPGPYKLEKGKRLDCMEISMQDLSTANIAIRAATKKYLTISPRCGSCGEAPDEPLSIDMEQAAADLYEASPEGKITLGGTDPHIITLGGSQFHIRPLLGKDAERMQQLVKDHEEAVADIQMAMHAAKVITPEGVEITGFLDILAYIGNADWDLRQDIEDTIDDLYGGLDEIYTWECERLGCSSKNTGILPLDITFYGLDTQRRQRRRRRHSTQEKSRRRATSGDSTT